jgi:hypothetical protein
MIHIFIVNPYAGYETYRILRYIGKQLNATK